MTARPLPISGTDHIRAQVSSLSLSVKILVLAMVSILAVVACGPLESLTGAWLWRYNVGVEPSGVAVSAGVVYASAGDTLHALDATTGELRWHYKKQYANFSAPVVSNNTVYVTGAASGDEAVIALDTVTGALRWRYDMAGPPAVVRDPLTVSDGMVYVSAFDGNLYALDAATGSLVWQYRTSAAGLWPSGPRVAKGTVYVLSYEGQLSALDAHTGELRWEYGVIGSGYAPPLPITVSEEVVYVGAEDGSVYILDGGTGELLREYEASGDSCLQSVVVGSILLCSSPLTLYARDVDTGGLLWSLEGDWSSAPVVSDGVVYVGAHDGAVYAFAVGAGDRLRHYTTGSYAIPYTVSDGVMYAGTGSGYLYAFEVHPPVPIALDNPE